MNARNPQIGFVLLEGLIAILIFSMAILGVVGMQATAITQASESQYRADAAFLANQLIGQMWVHAGSGVFVNGAIISVQAAAAPPHNIAGADRLKAAPNLYRYHCMACDTLKATTAGNLAGDPEFVTWLQSIQGGFLPGVSDTTNMPDIDVHCSTADIAKAIAAGTTCSIATFPASATQVTITLRWQRKACAPNTTATCKDSPKHEYQTLSNIEPN